MTWSELSPAERARSARRIRLEWASGGDVEHAAGVGRMIADAQRIERQRYGRRDAPTLELYATGAYADVDAAELVG